MHYKTFYRLSLAVPILILLLFYLLPLTSDSDNLVANILISSLMSSLMFAGKQYLFFAAVMFYFIGRLSSIKSVRKLFWFSPLIYIIFGTVGWHIFFFFAGAYDKPIVELSTNDVLDPFVFFSTFGLLFGYIYCLIVEMVFRELETNGSISLEDKDTKINGSLNKKS